MKNVDYIAALNSVHSIYKKQRQLIWQISSTKSFFPVSSNLTSHLYLLTPNYNVTFYANLSQLCTFAIIPISTSSIENGEVIITENNKH